MIYVGLTLLLSTFSFASTFNDLSLIKSKYSIQEGDYKLIRGDREDCTFGEVKIFTGIKNYTSLKVGGGLLAKHLEKENFKIDEKGCSLSFQVKAIKNGFSADEKAVCKKSKLSYSRNLKAWFKGDQFNYELRFKRDKGRGKDSTSCYLKKIK